MSVYTNNFLKWSPTSGGEELHHRPSVSRQQPTDKPRFTGRRPRTNTRSGSGSGTEDGRSSRDGDTATSMIYLNMNNEDRYIDAPNQVGYIT